MKRLAQKRFSTQFGETGKVINLEQSKLATLLGFRALSGVDITGSFVRNVI